MAAVSLQAQHINFRSPAPSAVHVSPTSPIVLRADRIPANTIVSVLGSRSGRVDVDRRMSADGTVLNLLPRVPFLPDETVTVSVDGPDGHTEHSFRIGIPAVSEVPHTPMALVDTPADFPPITVTTATTPSPGTIYLAPNSRVANPPYPPYLMVLDSAASPLAWQKVPEFPFEFKPTPDGRLLYTVFQSAGSGPRASSSIYTVDTNLTTIGESGAGNGYNTAQHDALLLPNGNRIVMSQENVIVDMSDVVEGGHPAASVQASIVQEIDPDGMVIFQWRSLDAFPVTATYEDMTAAAIRYVHANSVSVDPDGSLLVSLRHMSSVVKVNRTTGATEWVLGGKLNMFSFVGEHEEFAPNYFSYQHHVQRLPNGNVLMFDNGTQRTPQFSRGVEYRLDETAMTATMVWEYRHTPDIYVALQGGVQSLGDGHYILSWGSAVQDGSPAFTEVDADGNVVLEASLPNMLYPYRVVKQARPLGRASANVFIDEVLEGNTYTYTRGRDTIGMTVTFASIESAFYNATRARRYDWAPVNPRFADRRYPTLLPVRVEMVQEGITEHKASFRFDAARLGIDRNLENIVVYRRDTIGRGVFTPVSTRYNAASGEIVLDVSMIGEFAFGYAPVDPSVRPPRQITPVGGASIARGVETAFRVSPEGMYTDIVVTVSQEGSEAPFITMRVDRDRFPMTFPESGTYTWTAAAAYDPGELLSEPVSETFVVEDPFIRLRKPTESVTWRRDSAYVITWTTNLPGNVRLELVKEGSEAVVIGENVPASSQGYLWRVPITVPLGTGYGLRLVSVGQDTAVAETIELNRVDIIDIGTSVDEHTAGTPFRVLPNPAMNTLYVSADQTFDEVQLFAADGSRVLGQQITGQGTILDVSSLGSGHYVVVLRRGASYVQRHLLIQR